MFAVGGRSGALTASGDSHGNLWNPAGGEAITVYRVMVSNTGSTGIHSQLTRTSTQGTTPTATVTPDADNDFERVYFPSFGPTLEMGDFTGANPTVAALDMVRSPLGGQVGALGISDLSLAPITVPPGSGLSACVFSADTTAADVTFFYELGSSPVPNAYWLATQVSALATTENAICSLWNPHGSKSVYLHTILLCTSSTGTLEIGAQLSRSTTTGTSTSITATADNDIHGRTASVTGAQIRQNYTAEPTISTPPMFRWDVNQRSISGGIFWSIPIDDENGIDMEDCIVIPPGEGITIHRVTGTGIATTTMTVTFGWYE